MCSLIQWEEVKKPFDTPDFGVCSAEPVDCMLTPRQVGITLARCVWQLSLFMLFKLSLLSLLLCQSIGHGACNLFELQRGICSNSAKSGRNVFYILIAERQHGPRCANLITIQTSSGISKGRDQEMASLLVLQDGGWAWGWQPLPIKSMHLHSVLALFHFSCCVYSGCSEDPL